MTTSLEQSITKTTAFCKALSELKPLETTLCEYLDKRSITVKTIELFGLLQHDEDLVFPYVGKDNSIIGFKVRKRSQSPEGIEQKTYLQFGDATNRLWYAQKAFPKKSILYLVAGEMDCMSLTQYVHERKKTGFAVCTLTGGENASVTTTMFEEFKSSEYKEIRIVYDDDNTGRENAKKRAEELSSTAIPVSYFDWDGSGANHDGINGFDINSYLVQQLELDCFLEPHNFIPYNPITQEFTMTKDEKDEAITFLKDPLLFDVIKTDIEAIGYVGEVQNTVLQYLIATSRILDDPMSNIIKGSSSSGKSALVKIVQKLMPTEDVVFLSRMTTAALSHLEKNSWTHKRIIIAEYAATEANEEVLYLLRTLLSEREVSTLMTIKDKKGNFTTIKKVVRGPISLTETTTKSLTHQENETRCWVMYSDDSAHQTGSILNAQRKKVQNISMFEQYDKAKLQRTHANAQRLIKAYPVEIPFVEYIDFPSKIVRARRDFERFLTLIKVIAVVRQFQKNINHTEQGTAYLKADMEDYSIAYELAKVVLVDTLSEITKDARLVIEKIRQDHDPTRSFTKKELMEICEFSDAKIRRCISSLSFNGILEESGVLTKTRAKQYSLNPDIPDEEQIALTSPDEVIELLSSSVMTCQSTMTGGVFTIESQKDEPVVAVVGEIGEKELNTTIDDIPPTPKQNSMSDILASEQ